MREKKQEKYTGLTPQHTAILLKIVYPSFVLMQSFVFKLETFEEQQGKWIPISWKYFSKLREPCYIGCHWQQCAKKYLFWATDPGHRTFPGAVGHIWPCNTWECGTCQNYQNVPLTYSLSHMLFLLTAVDSDESLWLQKAISGHLWANKCVLNHFSDEKLSFK